MSEFDFFGTMSWTLATVIESAVVAVSLLALSLFLVESGVARALRSKDSRYESGHWRRVMSRLLHRVSQAPHTWRNLSMAALTLALWSVLFFMIVGDLLTDQAGQVIFLGLYMVARVLWLLIHRTRSGLTDLRERLEVPALGLAAHLVLFTTYGLSQKLLIAGGGEWWASAILLPLSGVVAIGFCLLAPIAAVSVPATEVNQVLIRLSARLAQSLWLLLIFFMMGRAFVATTEVFGLTLLAGVGAVLALAAQETWRTINGDSVPSLLLLVANKFVFRGLVLYCGGLLMVYAL